MNRNRDWPYDHDDSFENTPWPTRDQDMFYNTPGDRIENFEVEKKGLCKGDCDPGTCCQCWLCETCANKISSGLQRAFYRIGKCVGKYAVIFIIGALVVAGALGSGALMLEMEEREDVLWLPVGSVSERDSRNAKKLFPVAFRPETVIISAEDVLTPKVIKEMLLLDQRLKAVNNNTDSSWESVCVRLAGLCAGRGLLEIWNFDQTTVEALTKESIIAAVNSIQASPYFGGRFDAKNLLGGAEYNADGKIVKATSTINTYLVVKNETEVDGKRIWRERALEFEAGFLEVLHKGRNDLKFYYYAERSYKDVFADQGTSEGLFLLAIGYIIMTVFVVLVLGKLNRLEQRIHLALGGLLSCGLSFVIAMGLGTYMGYFYGPVHNVLALLLLGIGVDDIFVITHAVDRLPRDVRYYKSGAHQVALAMQIAGVSITVTSLTDFAGFAIGATTILPALRSFCVYCAIGLIFMFFLQITFFTACLSLDRWRVTKRRDACLPCMYLGLDYLPNQCSNLSLMSWFFKKVYPKIVTHVAFKVLIIIVSLGLLAMGIYGSLKIKVDSDFRYFFPDGSYPREYLMFLYDEFPSAGLESTVYFSGEVDYYKDFKKLDQFHVDLEMDFHILNGSVLSWYTDYREWLKGRSDANLNAEKIPKSEERFYELLKEFISTSGLRYFTDINFQKGSNRIESSRIQLMHSNTDGNTELQIQALDNIRSITKNAGLGEENCFAFVNKYTVIEVDKVLGYETVRNIGLALACVAIVTLILIANFVTCLLVLIAVVCSLVYAGGMAYFVGIDINIVSSLTLILTVGLSVDYAAHVGHTFMKYSGTRNERVVACLENIGGPVLLGGFSTFLAIFPLVFGKSFVLKTFFQIFASVIMFGLFNGLTLLPVLLSIFGPPAYSSAGKDDMSHDSFSGRDNPAYHPDREFGYDARRPKVISREPEPNGFPRNHHDARRHERPDPPRYNDIHHHRRPHELRHDRYQRGTRHYPDHREKPKKQKDMKLRHMYYSSYFKRSIPIYNKDILARAGLSTRDPTRLQHQRY